MTTQQTEAMLQSASLLRRREASMLSDIELLELAREAGIVEHDGCGFFVCSAEVPEIVRFAAMVVEKAAAAEREACALVCDEMHEEDRPGDYAYAIRARVMP